MCGVCMQRQGERKGAFSEGGPEETLQWFYCRAVGSLLQFFPSLISIILPSSCTAFPCSCLRDIHCPSLCFSSIPQNLLQDIRAENLVSAGTVCYLCENESPSEFYPLVCCLPKTQEFSHNFLSHFLSLHFLQCSSFHACALGFLCFVEPDCECSRSQENLCWEPRPEPGTGLCITKCILPVTLPSVTFTTSRPEWLLNIKIFVGSPSIFPKGGRGCDLHVLSVVKHEANDNPF